MAMTLEEMELETAELVPAREVMWCWYGSSTTQSNANNSYNGDQSQSGFSILSPQVSVNPSVSLLTFQGNFA